MKRGIPQREEILVSEGTCGGASWRVFRPAGLSTEEYERRLFAAASAITREVALARLAREAAEQEALAISGWRELAGAVCPRKAGGAGGIRTGARHNARRR